MSRVLKRGPNSFSRLIASCLNTLTRYVALLALLARMPPTACDEVDCRNVSGYTHGPVPGTCRPTAQLTLSDTDNEIINSLKAKYKDFPLRCRIGKYMSVA